MAPRQAWTVTPYGSDTGCRMIAHTGRWRTTTAGRRHSSYESGIRPARSENSVQFEEHNVLGYTWAGAVAHYLAHGVIITDRKSTPLFVNSIAMEIIEAADGLHIDAAGLAAEHPKETSTIRRMIVAAIDANNFGTSAGLLTVSRPSVGRPLTVLIVPLSVTPQGFDAPRSGAIVFVIVDVNQFAGQEHTSSP